MRVWERVVGFSLWDWGMCICGSGNNFWKDKIKLSKVHLKIGELIISWDGNLNNSVYLSGSVDYAFDGNIFKRLI